ncbi:MAG: S-layer homology domain-containing protein [Chloroflexi bacterium]|nr:S-layer homology domain-containing protein [Chloroflexota bacterium]
MKKIQLRPILLALLLLVTLSTTASAQPASLPPRTVSAAASFDIPLTVRENAGVTRIDDPVTWGVPLDKSFGVTSASQLQLTDALGQAVPTQCTVLARWGGAPDDAAKPIKWVLVDFQADVAANASAVYHLKNSTSPAHPSPIQVTDSAGTVEVDTGRARFMVSKSGFRLFDQVYLDRDGDAALDDSVLAGAGRISASYNGATYFADTSQPGEVTLERSGPLHTVLRVRGWLKDASGANKLLAYTARLHFYAGSAATRLEFTVWNDNVIANDGAGQPDIKTFGSPHTVLFDDLSVQMQLANAAAPSYTLAGTAAETWSGALGGSASLYQDSSGGAQWHHAPDNSITTFRGFTAEANGGTLHAACNASATDSQCRSRGWGGLSGAGAGVHAGVRYFWENYPKEIALSSKGAVRVGLFPSRFGTPFELRVGEQKTHEVLFYFGAGNVANSMTALQNPMQAWAASEYYLDQAKVFERFNTNAAANPDFTDYEGYVDAGILFPQFNLFILREGGVGSNWVYSPRPESWGWRNFGDVIAEDETGGEDYPVFTNLQYDHPWGNLTQAVRATSRDAELTGLWWYLVESGALHTADVDIVHSRCTGQSLDEMQTCTDPAIPIPVGWAMGARFTNQWHAWPVPDIHRNAAIDYWSGSIRGMLNYYYFTGNGMVRDAWTEMAENARWRIQDSLGAGLVNNNPGEFDGREAAYGLEIMTDAYSASGDPAYLEAAQKVVTESHPDLTWFGEPGYFPDPSLGGSGKLTGPWILGLIMKSLGNYLDMSVEWDGDPDPAARDSLLRYAELQTTWWRLGESQPTCYTIYENGGCTRDQSAVFLADGLAWALIYNDGSLDPATVQAVAKDAWQKTLNEPWGPGYPKNQYLTAKQHALQNMNGAAWMWYALHCTAGASGPGCAPANAAIFADVPEGHWARFFIESLYLNQVSGGCGSDPLIYCPDANVTRAMMAVFVLRAAHGPAFTPPPATGTVFADVPADGFAAAWIEQLAAEGITGGCGGGDYCLNGPVTRAMMAVFLVRARYGIDYTPPEATGEVFADVPTDSFAAAYIEKLAADGVAGGCGGGNFCPNKYITRAEMAVFLVAAFNLP